MRKYDTNKSGKLEADQVKNLLTDLDVTTPENTPPSEEELGFMMKLADGEADGGINESELQYLIATWGILTRERAGMDKKMAEFDKSGTGKLNDEELKAYLTSLNGGIEVKPDEVKYVLDQADVFGDGQVNKEELVMATAAWYVHAKEKEAGCCTVQ